jgi:hypothetical protein
MDISLSDGFMQKYVWVLQWPSHYNISNKKKSKMEG